MAATMFSIENNDFVTATGTENKNRSTYKIGRLTFYQKELTYGQDKRLIALFASLKDSLADEDIDLENIFELAAKFDIVGLILDIILKPKRNPQYWVYAVSQALRWIFGNGFNRVPVHRLKNSELLEIKHDFFLYNETLVKQLQSLLNGLVSISLKAQENLEAKETTPKTTLQKKRKKPETKPAK